MANQKLDLLIRAKEQASVPLKKVKGGVSELDSATQKAKSGVLGLNAATLGLTIGLGSLAVGLKKSFNLFVSFDKSLREINTIAKLNKKGLKEVENGLIAMSKRVPKSAEELGAGFYQILSAGIKDTAKAMEILEVSAKLATGGVAEMADTVKLVTGIVNAYGLEVEEAANVSDVLFKTVENGVTTIAELAQFMGPLIPVAKAANIGLEELTGAIATLTATGTPSRVAITSLKGAIFSLAAPTDLAKEQMAELGITLKDNLFDTIVQFKGLDLATIRRLIPEKEAAAAVLSLADNYKKFGANVRDAFNSGGASADSFNEQMKSTENKLTIVLNKFKAVGIGIGEFAAKMAVGATNTATATAEVVKHVAAQTKLSKKFKDASQLTIKNAEAIEDLTKATEFLGRVEKKIGEERTKLFKERNLFLKIEGKAGLNRAQERQNEIRNEIIGLIEIQRTIQNTINLRKKEAEASKETEEEDKKTSDKKKKKSLETLQLELEILELEVEAEEDRVNKSIELADKIAEHNAEVRANEIEQLDQFTQIRIEDEQRQQDAIQKTIKLEEARRSAISQTSSNFAAAAQNIAAISKEFAGVAKTAAVADATIQGILAVQRTLAQGGALAIPLAISIGVLTATNVARIVATPAFQTPEGAVRTVPGPSNREVLATVHGRERIGRGDIGGGVTLVVNGDFFESEEANERIFDRMNNFMQNTGSRFS